LRKKRWKIGAVRNRAANHWRDCRAAAQRSPTPGEPRLHELETWLDAKLEHISSRSDLAGAIRYARWRWPTLTCYHDHGQLRTATMRPRKPSGQ
jgi:hypothetical protein